MYNWKLYIQNVQFLYILCVMMTIINVPKVNIDTGICFIELVNFDYVSFVDVTVMCSTYKVACIYAHTS